INITNKGPVDRGDSTVTYWIGDGSRYYATTGVNVPARANVSIRKSFAIFSDEPVGVKNISVKVDYDPFYGPTNASKTFLVKAAAAQPSAAPSTGGAGGGGGAAAAPAVIPNISANVSLWITGYPAEIEIERGWAKFVTVTVNSSGVSHNVSVKFLDIPDEWFEVQTQPAQTLDGSKQFLVRFSIPSEIKSGNYKARLIATSAESSDEKEVIIRVFSSKEELIKYQLETIKEKILYLDALLNQTERDGKDVRKLRDALDGIKLQAENAESLLDRKLYDGASSTIITIKELLNTLEADIDALRKEKAEPLLASWALFGIIGLGVLLVIFFIYLSRKIKGSEKFTLQKFSEIKRLVLGKTAGAGLRGDMEKTRKMIKLIQKEYNEGMITKETYEELKRINEEKLLQSGKRMSDLGIKE
ncbi:MAG: hypothetical protein KKB25_00870, partial [Nanoarchaeota archaeon]|nr:hypothetical protein [Nanoarchaeota archaeon]